MFWAIATGRLPAERYGFTVSFRAAETEELNRLAAAGEADVVAVSIAHVPALADRYLLLPHGGSVGRGYGPVVVSHRPIALADLAGLRVGIPGERTTAARLLAMFAPSATPVVVPFSATLDSIDRGAVDAAVLIHEGRLVYARLGFHLVADLGVLWSERTGGLPLPLGGNVIRRSFGDGADSVRLASVLCHDSIAYALEHRDEAIDDLLSSRPSMSRSDADAYLRLYANEDSLSYTADSRAAIETLLSTPVEWATA
jgi:1,4-dihydroxy-6-naphthoate synthase